MLGEFDKRQQASRDPIFFLFRSLSFNLIQARLQQFYNLLLSLMLSSHSSSNEHAGSRELIRLQPLFLSTPSQNTSQLEHQLQSKLLKYKAKLSHYQTLMDGFYDFVSGSLGPSDHPLNSNRNTAENLRNHSSHIPNLDQQLQHYIRRLTKQRHSLQNRYDVVHTQYEKTRKQFKKNVHKLQRENQIINRQLGSARLGIATCQNAQFRQAKEQYLEALRISSQKIDQFDNMYKDLMTQKKQQSRQKVIIEQQLQKTAPLLEQLLCQQQCQPSIEDNRAVDKQSKETQQKKQMQDHSALKEMQYGNSIPSADQLSKHLNGIYNNLCFITQKNIPGLQSYLNLSAQTKSDGGDMVAEEKGRNVREKGMKKKGMKKKEKEKKKNSPAQNKLPHRTDIYLEDL